MLAASLERYGEELIRQGLEQGLEQGKQVERKDIAINLLKAGTELEFVSRMTGFSIEELKIMGK